MSPGVAGCPKHPAREPLFCTPAAAQCRGSGYAQIGHSVAWLPGPMSFRGVQPVDTRGDLDPALPLFNRTVQDMGGAGHERERP